MVLALWGSWNLNTHWGTSQFLTTELRLEAIFKGEPKDACAYWLNSSKCPHQAQEPIVYWWMFSKTI